MRPYLLCVLAFMLGICFAVGCGSEGPATYPLSGTIKLDGEPLEGAAIMLKPRQGGPNAYAVSAVNGTFDVMTFRPADGAIGGKHQIIVSLRKNEPASDSESAADVGSDAEPTNEMEDESELAGMNRPASVSLIPDRYSDFETSGLTVEVGPKNPPLVLELTDQ